MHFGVVGENRRVGILGVEGLEHHTKSPIKPHVSNSRGAESGALQGNSAEQFAFVAKVWQRLPADFRAAIVRTARRGMNRLNTQGLAKVGK